jgi:2-oxo-4-hydroxy-4-carboxy--5-ureidoimidazoline (OHCU) decarboxylase
MALMADSGQPVIRMQKSGPIFEHSRWPISMATDNTPAPSSLTAEIRKKTPPPLL